MNGNNNYEIKRQLYKRYIILCRQFFSLAEPQKATPKIGEQRKGYLIASLIFLALAIESFLNEFGYKYVDGFDEYEKFKTLDKIIILPQISARPTILIKKTDNAYEELKELFQYRNMLIHQKPKFVNPANKVEIRYKNIDFDLLRKHYKNVIIIMKMFQKTFKIYELDQDWISEHSENIDN